MSDTETVKKSAKAKAEEVSDDTIIIKKYANRRLYNTATSSYVTLDFLSELVKSGQDFVVFDAKSGEDITRPVLTQIIFEQENKGQNLLPVQFLRQLISYYGDSMQSYVPSYLEMSMDSFKRNQDKFKEQLSDTFGAAPGYQMFEDNVRKNMALYEQAMKMFTTTMPGMPGFAPPNAPTPAPSARPGSATDTDASNAHSQKPETGDRHDGQDIGDIKKQLAALQDKLSKFDIK